MGACGRVHACGGVCVCARVPLCTCAHVCVCVHAVLCKLLQEGRYLWEPLGARGIDLHSDGTLLLVRWYCVHSTQYIIMVASNIDYSNDSDTGRGSDM